MGLSRLVLDDHGRDNGRTDDGWTTDRRRHSATIAYLVLDGPVARNWSTKWSELLSRNAEFVSVCFTC